VTEEVEIDPADTIAVGALGPPGQRAFYIQVRGGGRSLTMLVEKVQVQALAERTLELLDGLEAGPSEDPSGLQEPLSADWRAGELGLGLDPDRGLVVLVAREAPEADDTPEETLSTARAWLRPAQMAAFAARGLELVAAGRPPCPLCGLPMDPEGHLCPRKNGKSPIF
jgi:uncharacterized repeat protein (TIGR03847 family)